ncbi:MAG: STAS/SEC14 domain-containing protein [Lewinellaceae bacterium]|nr:STAS/SEC14 domain-containing protein [Lewinellaceae bacterium]
MLEQIKKFEGNILAMEVIEGFTETDEKLAQKFFQSKLDEGHEYVHVLIKLDEMKLSKTSVKAFFEDSLWAIRNYKSIGNIAIVAHSNILKALVPIDSFFFQRLRKGFDERYFDVSDLDKAMDFISQ